MRGGKAFAAEQKIQELKSRIAKLNALKMKVSPTKIITTSSENMKRLLHKIYRLSTNQIEKKSSSSKRFRTLFNFHRIERTKKIHDRLYRFDKKKYGAKKQKLQENLDIGKKVLVLAERIRKKSAPGKFYKQFVQNIAYFNKEQTYVIRAKQKLDKIVYY